MMDSLIFIWEGLATASLSILLFNGIRILIKNKLNDDRPEIERSVINIFPTNLRIIKITLGYSMWVLGIAFFVGGLLNEFSQDVRFVELSIIIFCIEYFAIYAEVKKRFKSLQNDYKSNN